MCSKVDDLGRLGGGMVCARAALSASDIVSDTVSDQFLIITSTSKPICQLTGGSMQRRGRIL
jgi:hypothetical protein